MKLIECPTSGLILPKQFIDEKQSLKKIIDELVDKTVMNYQNLTRSYFLTLHAKFNKHDSSTFEISTPVVSYKIPPFVSNQFVFWVNNSKGICEILWMVSKGVDKKLKVDFNKSGVAYLQAKGAMPS